MSVCASWREWYCLRWTNSLKAAEEIFGHGVVVGTALAGHALADAVGLQTLTIGSGGVLDTAVAVEDETFGRPAAARHVQCAASTNWVSIRLENA